MNMPELFGKLAEVKKTMSDIKSRLDHVIVDGTDAGGLVKISMTANRAVKSVTINEQLLSATRKEELEELIEVAINRALENAHNVSETEMQAAGKGILPDIPGLF